MSNSNVHPLFSTSTLAQGSVETVPATLRVLRERLGLTRADLATKVNRTGAFVGQSEHVAKTLDANEVAIYAQALQVPGATLGMPLPESNPEGIHFRSNKISMKRQRQIIAKANVMSHALSCVLDLVNIGETPELPEYNVADYVDGPEGVARRVRLGLGLGDTPVPYIATLVEKHGGFVCTLPAAVEGVRGMTLRRNEFHGGPLVMVSDQIGNETRRFTLAHELGHLVLDRHSPEVDAREKEARADRFAGEFLAPYAQFRDQVAGRTPGRDLPRLLSLRATWGLHPASFVQRAYLCGDLTDRQRVAWFQALNARSAQIDSLAPVFPVHPTTLPALLRGLHEIGRSPESLAARIGFNNQELRDAIDGWEPPTQASTQPLRLVRS